MQILDPNHPFFQSPARRWATTLVPAAWGAVELWSGNPGWAVFFLAVAAYAFRALILKGPSAPE